MKYFIPTYEQAKRMVNDNREMCFFETKHCIDGYNISIFSYKLAWYNDFETPLKDDDINAYEMRGLTFIFDENNNVVSRHIMLTKFWNINQVEKTQIGKINNYKIKSIYNKEDGTLCTFIRLPNGNVYAKTKGSFGTKYSEAKLYEDNKTNIMNDIYNNDLNIKRFVDYCLDNDIVPLFEFVSPENKIVLEYTKTELRLLRLRNNNTGEYYDLDDFKDKLNGIIVAEKYNYNLDDVLKHQQTDKNREGFIIEFEDNDPLKFVKCKTLHYFKLHKLVTENLEREDYIIDMILNNTIDDVISQVPTEFSNVHNKVKQIENIIYKEIDNELSEIKKLHQNYNGDIKEFALKYIKHPYFHNTCKYIREHDMMEVLKNDILKKTYFYDNAVKWLKEKGYET